MESGANKRDPIRATADELVLLAFDLARFEHATRGAAEHSRPARGGQSRLVVFGRFAAAACLAVLFWSAPVRSSEPRSANAGLAVALSHRPGEAREDGERVDLFRSSASDRCVVMFILRTWNGECQCLAWELHRWEDGRALANLSPGELLDLPLAIANGPPVGQVVLVAASREAKNLPLYGEETDNLMACLNRADEEARGYADAATLASAVSGCLPDGVTVVPRMFTADGP